MDGIDNAINVVLNAGHSSAKGKLRSAFRSDAATVLFTWISSVRYNFESICFWCVPLSPAAAVLYPALS